MRRWLREGWYRWRRRLRSIPLPHLPRRQRLTREEADKLFPDAARCQHCGCWHDTACPRVRRIRFAGGTEVEEVEFWPWQQWPKDRLVTLVDKEALIE